MTYFTATSYVSHLISATSFSVFKSSDHFDRDHLPHQPSQSKSLQHCPSLHADHKLNFPRSNRPAKSMFPQLQRVTPCKYTQPPSPAALDISVRPTLKGVIVCPLGTFADANEVSASPRRRSLGERESIFHARLSNIWQRNQRRVEIEI